MMAAQQAGAAMIALIAMATVIAFVGPALGWASIMKLTRRRYALPAFAAFFVATVFIVINVPKPNAEIGAAWVVFTVLAILVATMMRVAGVNRRDGPPQIEAAPAPNMPREATGGASPKPPPALTQALAAAPPAYTGLRSSPRPDAPLRPTPTLRIEYFDARNHIAEHVIQPLALGFGKDGWAHEFDRIEARSVDEHTKRTYLMGHIGCAVDAATDQTITDLRGWLTRYTK